MEENGLRFLEEWEIDGLVEKLIRTKREREAVEERRRERMVGNGEKEE